MHYLLYLVGFLIGIGLFAILHSMIRESKIVQKPLQRVRISKYVDGRYVVEFLRGDGVWTNQIRVHNSGKISISGKINMYSFDDVEDAQYIVDDYIKWVSSSGHDTARVGVVYKPETIEQRKKDMLVALQAKMWEVEENLLEDLIRRSRNEDGDMRDIAHRKLDELRVKHIS